MHFFYAAVVGVDCRDSYLLTGKFHTLGTAEVTSIAGLQSTEGKKDGKERKKKKKSQPRAWSASLKWENTQFRCQVMGKGLDDVFSSLPINQSTL